MTDLATIVNNIEKLYLEAGKPHGSNWYHEAKADVMALAEKHGIDFKVVAAAVATLSPRVKWRSKSSMPNLDAADNLIRGFRHKQAKAKVYKNVAGFDHNKEKAWAIIRTGDVNYCRGPKVWAFFQNIIDPENDNYLTIDSWMTCIGLGLDYTQPKDDLVPTKKQAELIQKALRIVAYGYNMTSAVELQAVLWEQAKAKAGGRFA